MRICTIGKLARRSRDFLIASGVHPSAKTQRLDEQLLEEYYLVMREYKRTLEQFAELLVEEACGG